MVGQTIGTGDREAGVERVQENPEDLGEELVARDAIECIKNVKLPGRASDAEMQVRIVSHKMLIGNVLHHLQRMTTMSLFVKNEGEGGAGRELHNHHQLSSSQVLYSNQASCYHLQDQCPDHLPGVKIQVALPSRI